MCLFFQAEDGIRDGHVTGVQTCALPIYFILDLEPYDASNSTDCPCSIFSKGNFCLIECSSTISLPSGNAIVTLYAGALPLLNILSIKLCFPVEIKFAARFALVSSCDAVFSFSNLNTSIFFY